jgi:tetratricopeptide (TPR) repeat protein
VARRLAWRAWFCGVSALALGTGSLAPGQSLPESQAAEAAQQDSPEPHLGRGYADLKDNRYDEAAREFRAALALDPKLVLRARFPLGVALLELKRPEEARKEFEAVQAEVGKRPDVLYYLGRIDLTEGNFDGAIRNLTQAAAKPPFPDTAYYLGSAYLDQSQLGLAEKWLCAAAEAAPRDFRVQERLGVLYRKEGRKDESGKALALAADLRQRDAQTDSQRLDCIQKLSNAPLEEARPVCERLFDPTDPEKLTMLGTIYGERGDYAEALKPLRQAAQLSPNSPQMQYNLALVCFRLKRYDEARQALAGAVKLWPDLFELNALLGVVLYRLGEEPAAYQTLGHAHELNPGDNATAGFLYEVSMLLAQKSLADKQDVKSLTYLKTAAELRPAEPEPHRLMAEIYRLTGQEDRASQERREVEVLQH